MHVSCCPGVPTDNSCFRMVFMKLCYSAAAGRKLWIAIGGWLGRPLSRRGGRGTGLQAAASGDALLRHRPRLCAGGRRRKGLCGLPQGEVCAPGRPLRWERRRRGPRLGSSGQQPQLAVLLQKVRCPPPPTSHSIPFSFIKDFTGLCEAVERFRLRCDAPFLLDAFFWRRLFCVTLHCGALQSSGTGFSGFPPSRHRSVDAGCCDVHVA